jgi:hypothetical protein
MRPRPRWWILSLFLTAFWLPHGSQAQQGAPGPSEEEDRPIVSNSTVGYIDSAIIGNQIRLRYDTAYKDLHPERGEFIYAAEAPRGPGLPQPERRIDYQDISLYAEYAFADNFSAFAELPVRFANFEVNPDHWGLSDLKLGAKYAWVNNSETVLTSQLRVYVPTGNVHQGLGNGHTSLEPGLLLYELLTEELALEAELKYWVAVGGTEGIEGSLIRYGLGLHYDIYRDCDMKITPVIELVGWTFLSGAKTSKTPDGTSTFVESARGDTIINAKLGVRFSLNSWSDLYAGWGRALTGETFYKDIYRVEFRLFY